MSAQPDMFPPQRLLIEAQQEVMSKREGKGTTCPCCGQLVKVYKRRLVSLTARGLIWLYRQGGARRYVHVNSQAPHWLVSQGGYFAIAQKWGLIETPPPSDESKRTSGRWKLTALGVAFVQKQRTVPSHVHVFNNEAIDWSGLQVNIADVLGHRFDYNELMGVTTPATCG